VPEGLLEVASDDESGGLERDVLAVNEVARWHERW
jgi:hypothetical protein